MNEERLPSFTFPVDPLVAKRLRVFNTVANTSFQVIAIMKGYPRTGKRNRNILRKTYNRRPMNKRKRAMCTVNLGLATLMGVFQIAKEVSQPIPKQSYKINFSYER